jgi:hypothetical protein
LIRSLAKGSFVYELLDLYDNLMQSDYNRKKVIVNNRKLRKQLQSQQQPQQQAESQVHGPSVPSSNEIRVKGNERITKNSASKGSTTPLIISTPPINYTPLIAGSISPVVEESKETYHLNHESTEFLMNSFIKQVDKLELASKRKSAKVEKDQENIQDNSEQDMLLVQERELLNDFAKMPDANASEPEVRSSIRPPHVTV